MARFIFMPSMIPAADYIFQADDSQMVVRRNSMEFISGGFTISYVYNGMEYMAHIDGDEDRGWEINHFSMVVATGERLYNGRYLSNGGECGDTPTYGMPYLISSLTPDLAVPAE